MSGWGLQFGGLTSGSGQSPCIHDGSGEGEGAARPPPGRVEGRPVALRHSGSRVAWRRQHRKWAQARHTNTGVGARSPLAPHERAARGDGQRMRSRVHLC
jgi:hypothetical protein